MGTLHNDDDNGGHRDSILVERVCSDRELHARGRNPTITQILALITCLGILGTQLAMWTQKADKDKFDLLANDVSFIKGILTGDRPIPDKSPLHSTIRKP